MAGALVAGHHLLHHHGHLSCVLGPRDGLQAGLAGQSVFPEEHVAVDMTAGLAEEQPAARRRRRGRESSAAGYARNSTR